MKYNKIISLMIFGIVVGLISYGFTKEDSKSNRLAKVNKNDVTGYIAVNECFMWIGNNGMGSHDPIDDDSGFFWPGGENATIPAIFADGLIWGAKIGREIRVNGATYRYGLQAGKILDNGQPDNPENTRYRIYKIRKGWESLPPGPRRDAYETDYNEWPVEDGAPWVDINEDGIFTRGVDEPEFVGDEVLWCVSNDMDPSRSTFTYGSLPMGLEQHTLVFAFQRTGDLGDMVFKKYTLINKGQLIIKDMILGYWSDTDLGFAGDDYTGCDTKLSLGYTYNGDNNDEDNYGAAPPAIGYDFFQGPIIPYDPNNQVVQEFNLPDSAKFLGGWRKGYTNLPMTAFTFYINSSATYSDPDLGVSAGSEQFYNYMTGKIHDGSPFIDPNTGAEVVFCLTGDPVAGTGWYEGKGWPGGEAPNDRRHLMSSGKFTMMPGDTQEVVVGILIARGSDNINSVKELKRKDAAAQIAYDLDFQLTPSPPAPEVSYFTDDKQVTLYWNPNAESYDEVDKLIKGRGFDDETYTFEGYRVWQYSDLSGSDKKFLGSFDVANDINEVTQTVIINGTAIEQTVFELADAGIYRSITFERDEIKNIPLVNGNPYYYAVTAFGYSPNSDPKYLENPSQIIEVFPGKPPVDISYKFKVNDYEFAKQSAGFDDGTVRFTVIDPSKTTGDTYKVKINGLLDSANVSYDLMNLTSGKTLLSKRTDFVADKKDIDGVLYKSNIDNKLNIDGFKLWVENTGLDSLNFVITQFRVKDVLEVKGAGGTALSTPVDVEKNLNSTGKWQIKAGNITKRYNWQATKPKEGLGYRDYELRFTATGSEYYLTGYKIGFVPQVKSDEKAADVVPFEIWDIGKTPDDPSDDRRLFIKTWDFSRSDPNIGDGDKKWSQKANGEWEEIYAYWTDKYTYGSPLPAESDKQDDADHKIGAIIIKGDLPAEGTVVRFRSYKPLESGDEFTITMPKANLNDKVAAKDRIDKIGVFPNPYLGAHNLELSKYNRYVRFYGLPRTASIRIFTLSGVFIQKMDKDSDGQFVDWNLKNKDGLPVASGMYIAYIDLPGIGTKVLKIAIIQEAQYIDRI
ncbi:MAG: hypothetical protein KKB34_18485 [Bacteroidetes bacterium]|nr:hypothetical protein [Bacteroidota bacterium]